MSSTKSFFKKTLALLLSVVFAISSFAAAGFSTVTALARDGEHFMFAYFTGNDSASSSSANSQAIRFAVSDDGINFTALNDNKPIITQTGGSGSVRDPYLFQGADGYYYMIGTDLDAATMGWWGNQPQMVIWRSEDLVHWDHETYINTAQICGLNDNQVYRTWAPEVFYDEETGKYMVYFAFAADGYSSTRMHYMLTDDLLDQSHYSVPQVLYDPGYDDIDSDIIKQGDTYYMFYKDETPGRSSVCLATASALTGPYTFIGQFTTGSSTGAIEGCEVYTIGSDYYLVADRFGDNGKFAIYNLGSDLSAVAAASNDGNISVSDGNPVSTVNGLTGFQNLSARHGSIIHITKSQYNRLLDFGGADEATGEGVDLTDITLARYLVNDETTDEIGNTNLTKQGNPAWENKAFRDRERGAVRLTDGNYLSANVASMLSSNGVASNGFSVSFYGKPDSNSNSYGRFFEFNDKGIKGSIDYASNRGVTSYTSMSTNNNLIEVSSNYEWDSGRWHTGYGGTNYYGYWHHYVATFENGKFCLYIDGSVAYQTSHAAMSQEILDDLCANGTLLLGQAGWNDAGFTGYMRDFRIYSTALTESQATKVYRQYALDEEAEDAQAVQDLINNFDVNDLNKPTFNYQPYHHKDGGYSAVESGYYSNLVYSNPTNNSGDTSFTDEYQSDHFRYKYVTPNTVVGVYDGVTAPSMPVVLETYMASSVNEEYLCYAQPFADSQNSWNARKVEYLYKWTGYGENYQVWPSTLAASDSFSSQAAEQKKHSNFNTSRSNDAANANNRGNDGQSATQNNTSTHRFWKNSMQYYAQNADFGNNYYELISNPTMELCTTSAENRFIIGWSNRYYYYTRNAMSTNFYVINYKPIYDILDEAKAFYNNNISGKEWMYTTESLVQAMYALSLVANCNPNNYNYSSGAEAEVQKCAADIRTALEEYEDIELEKKTFNVNFVFADGTTTSRTITAGETLGTIPANTAAEHIDGTSTHNSYSWPEGATADTVVREDTDFEEVTTVESCSFTGEHTAASGALNGYTTYTCVCGNSYIEYDAQTKWSEYNDAVDGYNAIIGAEDYETKYTAASRTAYETEVTAQFIDVNDKTISDATIEDAADAINDAQSLLDGVADLSALDEAYAKANALLTSLIGKAPIYTNASVQALVDAVNAEGVSKYVNADAQTRAGYGIADETIANALAEDINTAYDALETTPPAPEPEVADAIEVYEEAVQKVTKLDPDAYTHTESIDTAINTANVLVGSESGVDYGNGIINTIDTEATKNDYDDATYALLSALANSVKTYTVTTVNVDSTGFNNGTFTGSVSPYTATYGTQITCTGDNGTAWFLEIQTGSMHKELSFQGYGSTLRTKVMGNTKIVAKKDDSEKVQIRIMRAYGDEFDTSADYTDSRINPMNFADYVDIGSTFELPAAPAIAYCTFKGYFTTDGTEITASSITINEDTDIIALYQNTSASCAINAKDITGAPINASYYYNDKVEIDGGSGTYAWIEATDETHYRPFFIGRKVSFYASESATLKAVSREEYDSYNFSALPTIILRKEGVIVSGTKGFFNGQVVSESMDGVQEYGVLIGKASTGTITADDLIVENSGAQDGYRILRAKSTKPIGEANQFAIGVNGLASAGNYIYRGYLIYKDGTTLRTVYTDVVTVD